MTQCFTNLIKIQLTSFKSVKKLFCINLLDSCFSWFWWTVVELCVGEHVIIALFTFSLNLFLEKEALTLKICKMLKIMLVLLQKKRKHEWCEATKVQTAISHLLEPYKASRPLGSSGDVYSVLQVKNWERWSSSFLNTWGLLKLKPVTLSLNGAI